MNVVEQLNTITKSWLPRALMRLLVGGQMSGNAMSDD